MNKVIKSLVFLIAIIMVIVLMTGCIDYFRSEVQDSRDEKNDVIKSAEDLSGNDEVKPGNEEEVSGDVERDLEIDEEVVSWSLIKGIILEISQDEILVVHDRIYNVESSPELLKLKVNSDAEIIDLDGNGMSYHELQVGQKVECFGNEDIADSYPGISTCNRVVVDMKHQVMGLEKTDSGIIFRMPIFTDENIIHVVTVADGMVSEHKEGIFDDYASRWNELWEYIITQDSVISAYDVSVINMELNGVENSYADRSPYANFFMEAYDEARDINLGSFLAYNTYLSEFVEDEEEFSLLKEAEGFNMDYIEHLTDMPTPVWRYPREAINELLLNIAGVTVDELNDEVESEYFSIPIYVEETDAYYNFTSDWGPGSFTASGGYVEEGVAYVYGEGEWTLVVEMQEDGEHFFIRSFSKESYINE